ncbi:MAG: 2-hydroxy-acid oxidase [Opitutales bacterium]|nr:2-hydroxy-acid oxidase [Opitutales bacterium]|tara:strand:+ start:433 stop:1515 length:1083 start_codon:yes stop_codon:yes gene_type:complete
MNFPAATIEEAISFLREEDAFVLSRGGGTKAPLLTVDGETSFLDLSGLTGIVEYEPSEYVFTARAGTTLVEINQALREHNQYLPFDPPLANAGATLGGTVAAGLSGPGRLRYGGLRDFVLGVLFANGSGNILKGGGRVVKNAAGFDFPKFLAGSLGRFAVLLELTFKVFPQPEACLTLRFDSHTLAHALGKLFIASLSTWEPDALELESDGRLFLRISGDSIGLKPRAEAILHKIGDGIILDDVDASAYWQSIADFSWAGTDANYAKIPVFPHLIPKLDEALDRLSMKRRYGMAGNVAWLSWRCEGIVPDLDAILRNLELPGLVCRGSSNTVFLGHRQDHGIHAQVKTAFDPEGRFPPLP